MVTLREIRRLGRRLVEEFNAQKVILFGSYANGRADEDSDVDLLVIMPFEGKAAYKSAELHLALRPGFPLDLIVRSPGAVRRRLELGDEFIRDIITKGTVLVERSRKRMGREGRGRLRAADPRRGLCTG